MQILINTFANIGGRGVATLSSIASVPLYIKYLGVDGYGVVSALTILNTLTAILENGLPQAVSREFATSRNEKLDSSLILSGILKSAELLTNIAAALGALVLGIIVYFAVPWWIKDSNYSVQEISNAGILLAAAATSRLPIAIYYSVMQGGDRQWQQNAISAVAAAMRPIIAILLTLGMDSKLVGFGIGTLLANISELMVARSVVWRPFSSTHREAPLTWEYITKVKSFAFDCGMLSLTAAAKSSLERVSISAVLGMEMFGIYSLLNTLANLLLTAVYPIANATWPDLARKFSQGRLNEMQATMLRAQALIVIGMAFAMFATCSLTQNDYLRQALIGGFPIQTLNTAPFFLSIGSLAAYAVMPTTVIMASTSVRSVALLNLVTAIILSGVYIFVGRHWGIDQIATIQIFLGYCYWLVIERIAFTRFKTQKPENYLQYAHLRICLAGAIASAIPIMGSRFLNLQG